MFTRFSISLLFLAGLIFALWACGDVQNKPSATAGISAARPDYALVIHGGAGTILKQNMTPEKEAQYLKSLNEALDIGEKILQSGGSAMDAVEKTIQYLEDNPLFNAGRGAVFTHEGKNELDASIMDGSNLKAGSVGGLHVVKHPITLARKVMENSPHVMLIGRGAEQFAIEQGVDTVPPSYFFTQDRYNELQKILAQEKQKTGAIYDNPDYKYGTVGCVALDKKGNLVAGTSTGGMTNKRWNRLGDVPIIGAGTYANNNTCGVSCTGHGEFFIRYTVAHDVSALMEYKGMSLQAATEEVVMNKLKKAGGSGGLIALDKNGNVSMTFNSAGMYRGYVKGKPVGFSSFIETSPPLVE
jgi:L-asparaginase / beta-aspartyl-peptidase